MPRLARSVFAGMPHHVTQRGNRREDVFFTDDDRRTYLEWLREYCDQHAVAILAYCLMSNHVHLVAVPESADGLERALKPLHMRYAQRINRARGWHGHLWQGRFGSVAMDEAHLVSALRYVSLNPVRAGLVRRAEDWRWSSVRAHLAGTDDAVVRVKPALERVGAFAAFLAGEVDEDAAFAPLCRRIIDVAAPGPAAVDVRHLPFRHAPRDLHPLSA